ncbi:DUF222 domain-containing protein [Gordonia soli]|uniref:Uncharacterized protein n=1 Tax=Gordonia soli NBRC 108243 TaxID=1223545 RepID=M0QJ52_9ACTN|nr:DUF222 domain-containing protein [Gordonia soli]GAC67447.1 hypothetical protein GS4_08_00310 [Gordonia soli NBRC 108243]
MEELERIVDQVGDLQLDVAMGDGDLIAALRTVLLLRNLIDHHSVALTGALVESGVPDSHGRSIGEILRSIGCAPSVAHRLVRLAGALDALPAAAMEFADGSISVEHLDAVVRGVAYIERRTRERLDGPARLSVMTSLLAQHRSGAAPSEISASARAGESHGRR